MLTFNGSAYADVTVAINTPVNTYSLACVASHANLTSAACAFNVSSFTVDAFGVRTGALFFRGDTAGDPIQMRHVMQTPTNTVIVVNSSNSYSVNAHVRMVGVINTVSGTSNHRIYNNGTKTTVTTPSTVSSGTVQCMSVGELIYQGTLDGSKLTGEVGRVAWWTVSLTDREAAAYNVGAPITSIRPQSLNYYAILQNTLNVTNSRRVFTNHSSTFSTRHTRSYFGG